jgi:hypothetical protein
MQLGDFAPLVGALSPFVKSFAEAATVIDMVLPIGAHVRSQAMLLLSLIDFRVPPRKLTYLNIVQKMSVDRLS